MVGDTDSGPRRENTTTKEEFATALANLMNRFKQGRSTEWLDDNRGGDVDTVRSFLEKSKETVDSVTGLVVRSQLDLDLAVLVGIGPIKKQTLEDVLAIQQASGLQINDIAPKSCEDLCRALSRELVRKIDGHDYLLKPEEAQKPVRKIESAADILAMMAPKTPTRKFGPVSRTWSYATRSSKTIIDLLNLLPESIGKVATPAASGGKRVNKEETGTGKRVNKEESGEKSPPKSSKRVNRDEGEGGTSGTDKLPTKANLIAHLESLNGETDAAIRDRTVKGLKGSKTVQWALDLMAESGLPLPT